MKLFAMAVMAAFATAGDHAPKDVRGGASLQVLQPKKLVELVGDRGFIPVSLGNFGDL